MKLAYSSKKISGYLLAFFLLFGIVTVASSTAQAQWGRDNDRYSVIVETIAEMTGIATETTIIS